MVLFAVFGVFATFGPTIYYEIQFRIVQARGIHYTVVEPVASEGSSFGDILKSQGEVLPQNSGGFASVLSGPKEQILVPKDTNFSILIPKIGANAKVIPNVDPSNENEFLFALQSGVAHAKGTVFPGMPGNIYLFAHSTDNFWNVGRYNAIFYLLKDLSKGDEIVVFFENIRHNYVVSESKIVDSSDVSQLTKKQSVLNPETLILQTCWPPGTAWKRLLVFAKPK